MKLLRALGALAYPFLLFVGLHWLEPRELALALAGLLALRAAAGWRHASAAELRRIALPLGIVAAVLVPTLLANDPRALLFAPVWLNLALLLAFGRSLRGGPSLVESLARLRDPELSPAQVQHCRLFTQLWCVFFALNAGIVAALAWSGDLRAWTLYTGLLAYLGMGALFAAEYVVRAWRFRNYQGSLAEPLFRRLFPQRPA